MAERDIIIHVKAENSFRKKASWYYMNRGGGRNIMERIERIKQMEACLERASVAVKKLSAALDKYEEAREAIKTLDKYLGSKQWKQDCKADEDGKLPKDLKRGVLSEDGIWNVLEESRRLDETIKGNAQ